MHCAPKRPPHAPPEIPRSRREFRDGGPDALFVGPNPPAKKAEGQTPPGPLRPPPARELLSFFPEPRRPQSEKAKAEKDHRAWFGHGFIRHGQYGLINAKVPFQPADQNGELPALQKIDIHFTRIGPRVNFTEIPCEIFGDPAAKFPIRRPKIPIIVAKGQFKTRFGQMGKIRVKVQGMGPHNPVNALPPFESIDFVESASPMAVAIPRSPAPFGPTVATSVN